MMESPSASDEHSLEWKVWINPITTAMSPVKMLKEAGTKGSKFTIK